MSCDERCIYCDGVLATRHEHDHFPVPKRSGGEATVCACINCHDIKDRQLLRDWPVSTWPALMETWRALPTEGRIFLAKAAALLSDQLEDS